MGTRLNATGHASQVLADQLELQSKDKSKAIKKLQRVCPSDGILRKLQQGMAWLCTLLIVFLFFIG